MKSTLNSSFSADIQSAIRNPQSAIILAFIALLVVSWRRWTSPIADSGREMDLPFRLLAGEVLYRDVHYLYPPLSPYFNSLLYRLFGVQLEVLLASGIVFSALIVMLSYRIARRILSPSEAAIASFAVIILCVFKPTGNLVSPYAFAALHGVALALGSLLLTLRYAETRRKRELIAAGALIGLAAITKQEFAMAAAITVFAGSIYLHRSRYRESMKDLFLTAIPAMIISLPVYGLLFRIVGYETLVRDCHLFYTDLPASLIFYNRHRTGLDRPILSLVQMLGAAGVGTTVISIIVLLSDRARRIFRVSCLVLVLSAVVVIIVKFIAGKQWDGSPLRAVPLLLVTLIVLEWRRGTFSGGNKPVSTALFIISVYSLAVLARVSLRVPSGGAFGGFFLPTSLILFCYLYLQALPGALENWTGDRSTARRGHLIGHWILMLTLIAAGVIYSARYRRSFNYRITAPRGDLFAPRVTGPAIDEALKFVETNTKPGEAVAVLPEGSDLAFLTGRRMPLRHQILIPGLMSENDERDAIAGLQTERVRYVLIVNRPMREFGAEAFGRDFYKTLGRWVDENYRVVKVCGSVKDPAIEIGGSEFFIRILEKRD